MTFQPDKNRKSCDCTKNEGFEIYRVERPPQENDYQTAYANQNAQIKSGIKKICDDGHVFDLIVVHGYFLAEAALFAKDIFRTPIVYHSHTDYGLFTKHEDKSARINMLSYAFERALCSEAYAIIAVSCYLKNLLVINFGQADKITIIPKGVDIDEYNRALQDKKLRRDRFFRAIFVGRISADKGVEVLLNAVAIAKKSIKNTILVYLVGTAMDQKYLDSVRNMVKELGLQSNVIFLGYKNQLEIIKLYCECDIAVIPSYGETFGKVAIEAMAAKIPVIVSDIGGLGEIVEHKKTGLKFQVGSESQLAECIVNLWNDRSMCDFLSENGYQDVIANYDISSIFDQTKQIYLNAVKI